MLTSSINFRVRPLSESRGDNTSKEALSELDQTKRDQYFFGNSLEKKKLKEAKELERSVRKQRRIEHKAQKAQEK